MGWLIALGVLTLIAILPVGVRAFYDAEGARAFAIVGPLRITLYPRKSKKKTKAKPKTKQTPAKPSAQKKSPDKKGGDIHQFLPVVDTVLDFAGAFGRKLRVNRLELKLILAGDDPADLARNYGRAWAVLGNLMPLLENALTIQKRDLEVECDFLADSMTILASIDLTITIGRILSVLLVRGIPVLRELMKIMNQRKGGAKA